MAKKTLRYWAVLWGVLLLTGACGTAQTTPATEPQATGTVSTSESTATPVTQAIYLPSGDAEEALNRAYTCHDEENFDCARFYYDEAIELNYNPLDWVYTNRGLLYLNNQDNDRAIEDFNKALELNSESAFTYVNRALAYKNLGRTEDAIADLETALALPDFYGSHDYAETLLATLQETDVAGTPVSDEKSREASNAAVEAGESCFTEQDYNCAMEKFDEAVALDATNPNAYYQRGVTRMLTQDSSGALRDLTKAMELDPQNVDAYYTRGYLYLSTGEYAAALEDFNALIELDPENAIAYSYRGSVYLDGLAMYDEAIADFQKSISLDAAFVEAHYNLGNAYFLKKEYGLAVDAYTQALELDPTNADSYANRGMVYRRIEKYNEALADFSQAIQLNPEDALSYLGRGEVCEKIGGKELAIADFKKVLELPNDEENGTHTLAHEGLKRLGEE
ncbi:MAG: tetratricopeptide repeat protein [Anaerolineae bacterium]|nr:tetratricopeptide repeat protein [Anaerolineae bacterium]